MPIRGKRGSEGGREGAREGGRRRPTGKRDNELNERQNWPVEEEEEEGGDGCSVTSVICPRPPAAQLQERGDHSGDGKGRSGFPEYFAATAPGTAAAVTVRVPSVVQLILRSMKSYPSVCRISLGSPADWEFLPVFPNLHVVA